MSLFWAVYGQAPTLCQGEAASGMSGLQHACQSLALDGTGGDCAAQATYHSCKGSNQCKTQGGCGFVQPVDGGGNCSSVAVPRAKSPQALGGTCGAPTAYSAPADNKCGNLGGCAVPISASQLYPAAGTMIVFDFQGDQESAVQIGTHNFALGDSVYDTAWAVASQVRASRKLPPAEKPIPTDLRVALPPST